MKSLIAVALLSFATTGLAQSGHDSHHTTDAPANNAQPAAQGHRASGVVKSVNAEKGIVTIQHGPVESLKWPAMTMGFKAKDEKVLKSVKPGQKVEIEFVQQGNQYVIVSLR